MNAKTFLKLRKDRRRLIDKLNKEIDAAMSTVEIPPVTELRPAEPKDIVPGAVIYYPRDEESFWQIVDEVYHPNDDFKAYMAEDGCRYGLHGAYVKGREER